MTEPAKAKHSWIKDARGRVVSQLDPVAMHMLKRHDVIDAETLRQIAQEVGFGMTKKRVRLALLSWILCLVMLGIALCILTIRLHRGTISTGRFFVSLVPYSGAFTGFFGFWVGARNARHRKIGRVMLEHLRCLHCGYDIRMLPVDPEDGATVCPECGCAWKLDVSGAAGDGGDVAGRRPSSISSHEAGEHSRG